MQNIINGTVMYECNQTSSAHVSYGSVEVVTHVRLCQHQGVVRTAEEHVVVRVDQIHIITQVLPLLVAVDVQRYLQQGSE